MNEEQLYNELYELMFDRQEWAKKMRDYNPPFLKGYLLCLDELKTFFFNRATSIRKGYRTDRAYGGKIEPEEFRRERERTYLSSTSLIVRKCQHCGTPLDFSCPCCSGKVGY